MESSRLYMWQNLVDDIQRPVVLGFAIFVPSDWLHPTTNFQSYGLVCSLRLPRLSLGVPACVWFIATLVACHTFLATWSTCHRLNFLPNLATLVVAILLATFFVSDTLCLSLVVAKLVMNEVQPWSLLDSTCGRIWWNVDDIQRPVVLGFAIFVPSDWLHPTTNFQSYSHTI